MVDSDIRRTLNEATISFSPRRLRRVDCRLFQCTVTSLTVKTLTGAPLDQAPGCYDGRMEIRVLLFASLREAAQARELRLNLPSQCDAQTVIHELIRRLPGSAGLLERSAVAINEQYATRAESLHDGDVVAVIPPVSGG